MAIVRKGGTLLVDLFTNNYVVLLISQSVCCKTVPKFAKSVND